jgi:hypothetical protein
MLTIVTSLYFPREEFKDFLRAIEELSIEYPSLEIICVEDSNDFNSLNYVEKELKESAIKNYKLLVNEFNLGQHNSLRIGLAHANCQNEYFAIIDGDGEEKPNDLSKMLRTLKNSGLYDVVYSYGRVEKKIFDRISSRLYYSIFKSLTGIKSDKNVFTLRVFTKNLREKILKFQESEFNIGALFTLLHQQPFYFEVKKSSKGRSGYNFKKRIALATKSIVSFSDIPLVMIGLIAAMSGGIAVLGSLIYVIIFFMGKVALSGFTTIVTLQLIFSSLILFCLSVLSSYIGVILKEVKRRPRETKVFSERNSHENQ